MPLKTLFLNPPSFENFDGGASSRWPATREIESYWYPVWLCYPAGMLPDSKVVDATMAKQMSFEARWGSACGTAFVARKYLAAHPQFDWMEAILKDRLAQSWAIFHAGQ